MKKGGRDDDTMQASIMETLHLGGLDGIGL
jgi:hypothetical protein